MDRGTTISRLARVNLVTGGGWHPQAGGGSVRRADVASRAAARQPGDRAPLAPPLPHRGAGRPGRPLAVGATDGPRPAHRRARPVPDHRTGPSRGDPLEHAADGPLHRAPRSSATSSPRSTARRRPPSTCTWSSTTAARTRPQRFGTSWPPTPAFTCTSRRPARRDSTMIVGAWCGPG